VRVNRDVQFIAAVGENANLVRPGDACAGAILDVWPDGVDPDLAWSGFTTAQGGRVVVFDFRRNRERVLVLLDRADQFHRSATLSLSEGLIAPAVEHLCSAAEQAVMTLIQLDGWNDRRNHQRRRSWLASEVEHGGAPASFSAAFDALLDDRNAARYGEAPVNLGAAGAAAVAGDVRALIDYAKARRG
jgi:hypothetical protein